MQESAKLSQLLRRLAEGLGSGTTGKSEGELVFEFEKDCAALETALQSAGSVDFREASDLADFQDVLVKAVLSLAGRMRLPQTLTNENEDQHFREIARSTTLLTNTITAVLSSLNRGASSLDDGHERKEGAQRLVGEVMAAVAPHCLVVVATHVERRPWTNDRSQKACQGLSETLCALCGRDSTQSLLVGKHDWDGGGQDGGFFGDVLTILRERLTRADWHKEPGTKQAFTWCLLQIKQPLLGNHLDAALPPSLLFIDDYKMNNKLLGLKCLQHIINNVAPAELRLYGRAVVIYEALHHHLFTQKAALIGQLLPCLIRILAVIERSPHKADQQRKSSRYDTVLQIVLSSMEFEQSLTLRRAYAKNLQAFIDSMGITILRHMKTLMRVIVRYLDTSEGVDEVSTQSTLHSLHALILQAWPRISSHRECMMKSLLKLLHDVCEESGSPASKDVRQSAMDGCVDCLILLRRCCGEVTTESLRDVLAVQTGPASFGLCLERALQPIT